MLLERGAAHVVAVDVGHGQIDPVLAADTRLTVLEGLNARDLVQAQIAGRRIDAVVADVSFISLRLALPPALALAEPGAWGVFLVKPQFEAGREAVGRSGVVRDPAVADKVAADIAFWLEAALKWRIAGLVPSPIGGGSGNREFLIGARRG